MTFAEKLAGDAFRREGVSLVVDAILARPVRELVDVSALVDMLTTATSEATVIDGIERHVGPTLKRVAQLEGRVGDLIPEESREEIEALIASTRMPAFAWAKDVVEPELFSQLLAPVLSEWLMQFVTRLPGVGGLAGAFAKRMRKRSSEASSSSSSESGSAVGDRLKKLTVDFSKSTLGSLREALRARLRSDEGRAIVAEIRQQAFHNTMQVSLEAMIVELEELPWTRIAELAPTFAERWIRLELANVVIRDEITAFVAAEATLGDLADRLGVLPDVRAYLRVQGETLLETLLANPSFVAWVAD